MMQFIMIRNGDAKTMAAAGQKLMQLQVATAKTTAAAGMPMQVTFTPAAKTVEDVVFDQFHTGFDMAGAQNPQMARIGQYMTFVYGQDGINAYAGVVNDTTLLTTVGIPDDKLTAAVDAAKSGDDPLSKLPGVTDIASQLPTQRVAVMYVPVDVIVNSVFSYMAKFGLDMGVTMPACDPIGFAISTEGSSTRATMFLPSQILTSASTVAGKLMVHAAGPGAPGAAGPGPGVAPAPAPGGGL
jgi:hypothetical protein